ncbi:MAG TPA: dihydrofolate reductase family protein [Mycobacteriales bacterium]|jgi:dihydrofolate reductase|nr:dihydrofolate reductase family protein [Mycobacteriales bacterium]
MSRREQIRGLRDSAQGDLYFFGGSEVAARLIQLDLIDEYQIFVHPVVLGGGSSLFPTVDERRGVSLVETRPFGDVVSLRYARKR